MLQKLQVIEDFYLHIAPNLIGTEVILPKQIAALQMFSIPELGEKFHILFIGEPASGKSDFLLDVSKIAPNSFYASSSNVTKVGLLQFLGHCDRGIACIDELDKISKHDRGAMLEAMATQQITKHIHKQHYTTNARTNVLAACNPIGGILSDVPITEQIYFHPAELSRFDVILKFKKPEKTLYPEIAIRHNPLDIKTQSDRYMKIKEYIIRVRQDIGEVKVPEDIRRDTGSLISMLIDLSPLGSTISQRQIFGALSMMKAHARMNLRNVVTREDDFEYIYRLLHEIYEVR